VGQTVAGDRGFGLLVDLVRTLRSDTGCPWDRAQTPEKIKIYLIEEAYEVLDALESGSNEEVCGELGDLLFHIVFFARLFEEAGAFDIEDVVRRIVQKMIRRHPHVFGKAQVNSVDDVKAQWQEIKATEPRKKTGKQPSLIDGVPAGLPILMRAYRVAERASMAGLNFPNVKEIVGKIDDEFAALKDVLERGKNEAYPEKLGNLLFAISNLSRSIGVHPETALRQAVSRFVAQFEYLETLLEQQGRTMASVSQEEMNAMWKKRKRDA